MPAGVHESAKTPALVPSRQHRHAEVVHRHVGARIRQGTRKRDQLGVIAKKCLLLPFGDLRAGVDLRGISVHHAGIDIALLVELAHELLQDGEFYFPLHVVLLGLEGDSARLGDHPVQKL